MNYENLKAAFVQGCERESAQVFNEVLRGCVRQAFWEMMSQEVSELCGARYAPDPGSDYYRAGTEEGSVYLDGSKERIRRPRVRHKEEGEVSLESYQVASSQANVFDEVVAHVAEGMSQRGLARVGKAGVSKSSISRMWADKSREQLEQLRTRPLDATEWLCVLIDGVFVGGENCLVVAVGIDSGGRKQVLDFEAGSSESAETVGRVMSRLAKRGVQSSPEKPILAIRDGSEAIKSALIRHWPSAVQQACLIHVERNIGDRLRRRDRSELQRLFRSLRQAEGREAGEEAFEDLREFLAERNAAAALALNDRKEEILAVHRLNLPATLNVTLLSTNVIENVMRNWREQSGNVKAWNVKGDMLERWGASGLLWAESGFRRVRHHEDFVHLKKRLHRAAPLSMSSPSSLRSSCEDKDRAESEEQAACPK